MPIQETGKSWRNALPSRRLFIQVIHPDTKQMKGAILAVFNRP